MTIALKYRSDYLYEVLPKQKLYSIIIGGLPGYIFFSTYVILAIFWYLLYFRAHEQSPSILKGVRRFYFGINIIVYGIWFILIMLMYATDATTAIHKIEAGYAGTLGTLWELNKNSGVGFFRLRRLFIARSESLPKTLLFASRQWFQCTT